MTSPSKQGSAKQRKSRTSAKTSDRRKAGLDASKAARHTAYENKRVLATAVNTNYAGAEKPFKAQEGA